MIPSDHAILALLQERVGTRQSPGIVVGLLDEGTRRIISYGDARPGGPPLDARSVFEIGSVTKVFTTTVLADMVVEGCVALEDPVAKYLPSSVRVPSRGGREITLLDLAMHTSGLPRIPSNLAPYDPTNPYAAYSVQQLYDFLTEYELPRDIGTRYEYSNLGAGLLGHALALEEGLSYEALVRTRVLDPLGMRDTRIALDDSSARRLVQGHDEHGNPVPVWDMPAVAGAGAFRSTASDMLAFLAASLDLATGPLAAAMRLAQPSRHPVDDAPNLEVGLGWHTLRVGDSAIVWHNGQTGGYHAFIGVDHATGGNAVVLSASSNDIDDIGFHLIDQRLPTRPPAKARTEVSIDSSILDRFVGTYELEATLSMPAFTIAIVRDGVSLAADVPGKGRIALFAETESEFFLKVMDAQVVFVSDGPDATGLVLHQRGITQRGWKTG
jgi:CubicO group peptidase (beta-lactamase class C family)